MSTKSTKDDLVYLKLAVDQAKKSVKLGGFPAGAVLVKHNQIIGRASALGNKLFDPTSHPEIALIRKTCRKLKTTNLSDCVLYVSMESCPMCFMADSWANIPRIVYACRRSQVSPAYYGSSTDIHEINKTLPHSIDLVFLPDYEPQVLKIIKNWENKNN